MLIKAIYWGCTGAALAAQFSINAIHALVVKDVVQVLSAGLDLQHSSNVGIVVPQFAATRITRSLCF
jgi:hypothetical protein